MSAEENKALVRRYFKDLYNQKELYVADEIIAPDCVFHGVILRRERSIVDMKAEGDKVVVRWTSPTDRETLAGITSFHIADGKIAEIWEGYDILPEVQAFRSEEGQETGPSLQVIGETLVAYIGIPAVLLYPVGFLVLAIQLCFANSLEFFTAWHATSQIPTTVVAGQGGKVLLVPFAISLIISPLVAVLLLYFKQNPNFNRWLKGTKKETTERESFKDKVKAAPIKLVVGISNLVAEAIKVFREWIEVFKQKRFTEKVNAAAKVLVVGILVWGVIMGVTLLTDHPRLLYFELFSAPAAILSLVGGALIARDHGDENKLKLATVLTGAWLWRGVAEKWVFNGLLVAYLGSVLSAVLAVVILGLLNQNPSLPGITLSASDDSYDKIGDPDDDKVEAWNGAPLLLLSYSNGYWYVINEEGKSDGDVFLTISDDDVEDITVFSKTDITAPKLKLTFSDDGKEKTAVLEKTDAMVPKLPKEEATSKDGAVVPFTVTANDRDLLKPEVTCRPASGETFPLGEKRVRCSSKDAAGNEAKGEFKVIVEDTTGPELNLPNDINFEAENADGAKVDYEASANDAVDGSVDASCSLAPGSVFDLGETTVNCSATDQADNKAEDTFFTVTVKDTTDPTFNDDVPSDIPKEATGPDGASVTYTDPTATDGVDSNVDVSCEPPSGSIFALDGNKVVICTAKDDDSNEQTASFNVKVQDTTAPTISGTPEDQTVEATGPDGATVTYSSPTATDIVDGDVSVSCVPAFDTAFGLGTTTVVTCSATDKAGFEAKDDFTITIEDTRPPTTTPTPRLGPNDAGWHKEDVVVDLNAEDGGSGVGGITYSASGDQPIDRTTVSETSVPVDITTDGETTITYYATDNVGNPETRKLLTVKLDKNSPAAPTITVPDNNSFDKDGSFTISGTAEADSTVKLFEGSDQVGEDTADDSGNWTVEVTGVAKGSHIYKATANDTADNESGSSDAVTVKVDKEAPDAPEIMSPADGTANESTPTFSGTAEPNSTVELFDGNVSLCEVTADSSGNWSFTVPSSSALSGGYHSITAMVTDEAGNTSPASTALEVSVDTAASDAVKTTNPA